MKQTLFAYLFSLLFLIVGSLITSSLLSGLYYYHVLSTKIYELIAIGIGLFLFLGSGLLLGRKTTKKALFHALIFVLPFLLIAALSQEFNLQPLLLSVGKGLTYTVGTIIGVNLKSAR